MKTKNYINLLIVLTLALNACKKSGGADNNVTPTVKKYVTQQVIVSGNVPGIGKVTSTTDYTYDSKKRKQTEKIGDISFTYTYNDNNTLSSSTQLFGDGNTLRYIIDYTYTGSLLTRVSRKVYKKNEEADNQINDYVYDGNNRLIEDHYGLGWVRVYTYGSNNDVAKMEDRQTDVTYTYLFTSDANHRVITQSRQSNAAGAVATTIAFSYDSHGNTTKTVTTTGATITTVNTTYVYDADGYVTSYTADNGGSGTYTYSTL